MADPIVLIPMLLSAFHLSPPICDDDSQNPFYLAPLTQPDYTSLRLDHASIAHDVQEHIDLSWTRPAAANNRITDLATGLPRRNRLGIVLHWSLPKPFRWGTSATASTSTSTSDPKLRTPPNRWLVVRHVEPATIAPAVPLFPEFDAWVVESDRIRHISELDVNIDLETDVAPFLHSTATGKEATDLLNAQAETFLGLRAPAHEWHESGSAGRRVDLGVLASANPFFADYAPHCANVFSITDTFAYAFDLGDGKTETRYLEKADASYCVIGWHSDGAHDLFAGLDMKASIEDLFSGLGLSLDLTAALAEGIRPRTLTVGRMYNVAWNYGSKPANPLPVLNTFTSTVPLAVSTTPSCALKVFQDGFPIPPVPSASPTKAWQKTTEQAMLQAASSSRTMGITGLEKAKELLEQRNLWRHEEGGSRWKVSALKTTPAAPAVPTGAPAKSAAPAAAPEWENFAALVKLHRDAVGKRKEGGVAEQSPLEILEEVNMLQRHLDALTRRRRYTQWQLFAEWWKWIAEPENSQGTAKEREAVVNELVSQIHEYEDKAGNFERRIEQSIHDLKETHGVPCEKAPTERFYTPKDPSLFVAGIPNPWPADYNQSVSVRLDSQVVRAITLPDPQPWGGLDAFSAAVKSWKILPESFGNIASAIISEFAVIRAREGNSSEIAIAAPSPPNAVFPSYHCSYNAEVKDYSSWNNVQPFFPLFCEWEAVYYHIPFDFWELQDGASPFAADMKTMRYGLRDIPQHITDTRVLSGRNMLLLQTGPSLDRDFARVLDKMTDGEKTAAWDPQWGALLTGAPILSSTMKGLRAHLTTRVSATHVKPTLHIPGKTAVALPGAAEAAHEIGFMDKAGKEVVSLVGEQTGLTPYGSLVEVGDEHCPFKPVSHGQMVLTKMNIVDRFGQVLSPLTDQGGPKAQKEKLEWIYPCIGEEFKPSVFTMKDGTTMAPLTVVPEPEPTVKCGVLQVPVGLNQAARLNGCFVVPEARHHGGGKWRPVNEWESPVWGWLVVNYADYGLQIFNADGKFHTEVRLGSPSGAVQHSRKLRSGRDSREDNQLNRLTTLLNDETSLKAFFSVMNGAISNTSHAPASYASFFQGLIGRPFALVNMGWSLELAEPELTNQATSKVKTPEKSILGTNGYEFKLKLGDHEKKYDGLAGYFLASAEGAKEDLDFTTLFTFFPSSAVKDQSAITTAPITPSTYPVIKPYYASAMKEDESDAQHSRALAVFGAIIDPFSAVHATTGILPTAAIKLHPWVVEDAMRNLEASFRLGPLIVTSDLPPPATTTTAMMTATMIGSTKVKLPAITSADRWMWLQPYLAGKEDTSFVEARIVKGGNEVVPGWEKAPYTALEGYLRAKSEPTDVQKAVR